MSVSCGYLVAFLISNVPDYGDKNLNSTQHFDSMRTFFEENYHLCESSTALVQQASMFSFREALDASISMNDVPARQFLCFTLPAFIKHMVKH